METLFGKKHKKSSGEMTLQITSMADIFTIILVFLLKTTASGINTVSPNGATLPVARGIEITHDTLKLEISRASVMVDDKDVLALRDFDLPATEIIDASGAQTVYRALARQRQLRPQPNAASDLLILADQDTPFSTLKPLLASAANSGFVDLQLVVVQNE